MNRKPLSMPDAVSIEMRFRLQENISAIESTVGDSRRPLRRSAISGIPRGAVLEVCRAGFNERTTKVRCNGKFYFVFLRDVERVEPIGNIG